MSNDAVASPGPDAPTQASDQGQPGAPILAPEPKQIDQPNLNGRIFLTEAIRAKILEVAGARDMPVLITGASGTGKSDIAREIHDLSPRKNGPFAFVNAATLLDESLTHSALFGHERGSYTGATKRRAGLLQTAHLGTLFLDEVGAMSHGTQVKLLNAMETGIFFPVGKDEPVQSDFRLIAATNEDVRELVKSGRLRLDFVARLAGASIKLDPLRETPQFLISLADYLLKKEGKGPLDEAMKRKLIHHPWVANIRELKTVLAFACHLAKEGPITLAILQEALQMSVSALLVQEEDEVAKLQASSRDEILTALLEAGGEKDVAASRLGISRSTLYRRCKELGIDIQEFKLK